MKKLAIFASGNGTNFQAIVDAVKAGRIRAEVALMVCDKKGAFVIERAEREHIPTFVFHAKDYKSKADYEQEILQQLKTYEIDLMILAGYMRLIGPTLLNKYAGRIVNIHPSLLPAFPGKDAIGQALAAGVKVSGVTVHYVDDGLDTGPIIAQKAIEIVDDDTAETVAEKIHRVEHELYPKVIQQLIEKLD